VSFLMLLLPAKGFEIVKIFQEVNDGGSINTTNSNWRRATKTGHF